MCLAHVPAITKKKGVAPFCSPPYIAAFLLTTSPVKREANPLLTMAVACFAVAEVF